MGTIGSLSNYQLSSLLSGGSGSAGNTGTTATPSLAAALDAISNSSSSSSANAYSLNLSPQAQLLMNGLGTSSSSSSSNSSTSFQLTQEQQTAISNILAKYKDAPFTQDTFTAIQKDLQAAGLSPQTLSTKDQVSSFNATNTLISALNGDDSSLTSSAPTAADEQTKQTNYLQSIVSQWKSVSTTASSTTAVTA